MYPKHCNLIPIFGLIGSGQMPRNVNVNVINCSVWLKKSFQSFLLLLIPQQKKRRETKCYFIISKKGSWVTFQCIWPPLLLASTSLTVVIKVCLVKLLIYSKRRWKQGHLHYKLAFPLTLSLSMAVIFI